MRKMYQDSAAVHRDMTISVTFTASSINPVGIAPGGECHLFTVLCAN